MPKKNWTDEERVAFAAKMKAARAAKKAPAQVEEVIAAPVVGEAPAAEHPQVQAQPTIGTDEVLALLKWVKELSEQGFQPPQGAQVRGSRLVGTTDKYIVDPSHYPNPTERLENEPGLRRFAFKENYELEFEVTTTSYETKDGLNMREPKFRLSLIRKLYDEVTGELTNRRYTVCQLIFHEDPQAALVVARDNGVEIPAELEADFLDEMRYLRMRDWLVEAFYPTKPAQDKKNKQEMVIGGKLVEVFEINSENSERIPFDQITKQLRG
jgi:hypothetical protein